MILQNAFCFDRNGEPIKLERCRGALIFLDGYDELKTQASGTDIKTIVELYHYVEKLAVKYGMRVVITTRTAALADELRELRMMGVTVRPFADLSEDEQRNWIYSEHRPKGKREQLIRYWEENLEALFQKTDSTDEQADGDDTMRLLLGIPIIFRMVVNKQYTNARNTQNKAQLYEDLFSLTIANRETADKKLFEREYAQLAFDIFLHNEDTACVRNDDSAKKELTYFYYLFSRDRERTEEIEIGFIHRSFYQYFLALFFYSKLLSVNSKEKAMQFLGYLAGHILDEDVINIFYEICENKDEALPEMTAGARHVLEVLGTTSGMIEECIRFESRDTATVERIPIKRANAVFLNGINICTYFNVNDMFVRNEKLLSPFEFFSCNKVKLANKYTTEKDGRDFSFDLAGAEIRRAKMDSSKLQKSFLRNASIFYSSLRNASFEGADLSDAFLTGADLQGANFSFANLQHSFLMDAKLDNARLQKADLRRAHLNGTHLSSTISIDRFTPEISSFPIPTIGYAQFDYIYVDQKYYTRKEFFDTFQPGTDYLDEQQ